MKEKFIGPLAIAALTVFCGCPTVTTLGGVGAHFLEKVSPEFDSFADARAESGANQFIRGNTVDNVNSASVFAEINPLGLGAEGKVITSNSHGLVFAAGVYVGDVLFNCSTAVGCSAHETGSTSEQR